MKLYKAVSLLCLSSYSFLANAELHMPNFFTDNMVLQQKSDVDIWGSDSPNTEVSVKSSWGETARTTTDDQGKWRLTLATKSAATDQQLVISGSNKKTINNINLGEVWICSGQSNMAMPMKGFKNQPIAGSNEAILNSHNNDISLFTVERNASLIPQDNVTGNWQKPSPTSVKNFSATCYFFGKKLHDVLNVPVGLISSAWGGTIAEAWTPKANLNKLDLVSLKTTSSKQIHNMPSTLYNAMIHPFIGYKIKGFTWYQGESNHTRASEYQSLFSTMIKAWRESWKDTSLPFYFTQIAPFSYNNGANSAFLREAQLNTMLNIENTGMAVTLDIGDCANIHPKDKEPVGVRLAYWALAKNYGFSDISYSGPIYKSMNIKGHEIELDFMSAQLGINSIYKSLDGFEIAGQDKIFYPAESEVKRRSAFTVWSTKVNNPVAVRYAFKNCPKADLFGTNGLPASSFRTDNW